jgi:hypothetical protein
MNGIPEPPSLWQETRNAEGRVYYYNVQTKATQWNKPLALMTPVEVRLLLLLQHNSPICTDCVSTACPLEPAMERIHSGGRSEVLVQYCEFRVQYATKGSCVTPINYFAGD